MSFGIDDYEKAIVRIWRQDGESVTGTGFLVAPGYVLTCAHVVLESIGISQADFEKHLERPTQRVALDFHIFDEPEKIQAEVVDWLPYRVDGDDIAVLRLLRAEPKQAKPIPLRAVGRAELENEKHLVYGFGQAGKVPVGGRTDDYRPKANVAGGRFLLCKLHDSNDETIQPGFSGSPVWNEARKCVIGMIATATEKQCKAYAIPTERLNPSLSKISAFCLHDVLVRSLKDCPVDESYLLKGTIDGVLQNCHPNKIGDDWQAQLIELLDLPPNAGWEAEGRLVQFVLQLVRVDEIPEAVYDRLRDWVEHRSFDFAALLERITREMKAKKVPLSNVCEHLMVVVKPRETSIDEVSVTVLAVPDRMTYNSRNPMLPIVPTQVMPGNTLPEFIRDLIRQKFRTQPTPMIHLFVPRSLFCCDVAMQTYGKRKQVLGRDYPFVIRTNLTLHPIGYGYYDDWNRKWERIEEIFHTQAKDVIKAIDCSQYEDVIDELININAAMLHGCDDIEMLFEDIANETALPVALWSREPLFQERLADMLDCEVGALGDRIRQERDTAHGLRSEDSLGNHLSLVWEDPKIVPPDMRFES